MEAMASGVPVVACKVGGIPDLVAHGVTGWLVDAGDCDGLATRVVELLEDGALSADMGRASRERAVQRLSLDQGITATTDLFAKLSNTTGASARVRPLPAPGRPIRSNGSAVESAVRS